MGKKFLKILDRIEEVVLSFFFIIGSAICIFGVFMRYVMHNPVTWSTELFELFMVTAIFLGFGPALKNNQHIKIDLLYDLLPKTIKKIFNLISNALGFGFSIYLAYMGIEMVSVAYEQKSITVDVGIPVWITFLAMPLGLGLLAFYFFVNIIRILQNKNIDVEMTEDQLKNMY
ncbi:MAG: TRAP transporter small permease [Lysinibacillus sp.]|nr:TRAP transporter small permease [Lysinibacillus sp.]